MSLADFLRKRLDEEVVAARRSMTGSWSVGADDDGSDGARILAEAVVRRGLLDGADAVEREGRASYAEAIRRTLATTYAEHPDYRDEWSPAALTDA